jgi:CxxC-x17-CxxC domain-containing protein
MKDFKRESKFPKKPSRNSEFGNSPRFSGVDSRVTSFEKQMHRATCAKCGAICEVPFKPTSRKPVYCKNCFSKDNGSDSRRSDNFRKDNRFESNRPNFFGKEEHKSSPKSDNHEKEFEKINKKLDKILKALEKEEEEDYE